MSDVIRIFLAGAPVGKGRPRFVRATGHAFTPEKTRNYETHLRLAAQDVMGDRAPLLGAVEVKVEAACPIPKSFSRKNRDMALAGRLRPCTHPDVDNILKALDALNEIVWKDDRQIVDSHARKIYSDKPGLTVLVRSLDSKFLAARPALTGADCLLAG